jgi:hypothetical protein
MYGEDTQHPREFGLVIRGVPGGAQGKIAKIENGGVQDNSARNCIFNLLQRFRYFA